VQKSTQSGLKKKAKVLWKEAKFTFVQGFKDLFAESGWLLKTLSTKRPEYRTGKEQHNVRRTTLDLLKFVPYSFFLFIPFTEILLPPYLYYFPNSTPSFFMFDTAKDKKIELLEK
jgi:hypothetical protein